MNFRRKCFQLDELNHPNDERTKFEQTTFLVNYCTRERRRRITPIPGLRSRCRRRNRSHKFRFARQPCTSPVSVVQCVCACRTHTLNKSCSDHRLRSFVHRSLCARCEQDGATKQTIKHSFGRLQNRTMRYALHFINYEVIHPSFASLSVRRDVHDARYVQAFDFPRRTEPSATKSQNSGGPGEQR